MPAANSSLLFTHSWTWCLGGLTGYTKEEEEDDHEEEEELEKELEEELEEEYENYHLNSNQ